MQWRVVAYAWSVALAISAPALAQTIAGPWVAGRVVWDSDRSWGVSVPAGWAGGAALGLDLNPRLGFELALDWPMVRTIETVRTSQDKNGPFRTTSRDSYRSPGGLGFLAIRTTTSSRVQLTFLVGLAFLSHNSTHDGLTERLDANGTVLSHTQGTTRASFPWGGPAVGLEMPVRVSKHVSIVPEVHAVWFPLSDYGGDSAVVRGAIGIRWKF